MKERPAPPQPGVTLTIPYDCVAFLQRRAGVLHRSGFLTVTPEDVMVALLRLAIEDEHLYDPEQPLVPLSIAQRTISMERTQDRATAYAPSRIEARLARTSQPRTPVMK
jgi:hypothetical protein